MLLGVTLSHLHQSSLGTLMTLIPHKMNVLWWSEQLPLLYLFSAMMAGPAMAILEHLAAARWLGFEPRMEMLAGLARIEAWLVGLFLAFQMGDLVLPRRRRRHAQRDVVRPLLLGRDRARPAASPGAADHAGGAREPAAGSPRPASLVVAGVLLHRLNVAVIGLRVRHWETYVPSLGEVGITLGITAGAVFVFGALVRILPIHEESPPRDEPAPGRSRRPAHCAAREGLS